MRASTHPYESRLSESTMVPLVAVVGPTGRIERLEISGRSPVTGEVFEVDLVGNDGSLRVADLERAAAFWTLLLEGNADDVAYPQNS